MQFSRIHSSFVAGISRRLLRPARSLRRLTSVIRQNNTDRRSIRHGTARLHRSYSHLRRVVSSLLLLVGTRRPVLPATSGHVGIVRRMRTIIRTRLSVTTRHNVAVIANNSRSLYVGNRTSRVRTTLTGLVRGTVACSGSNSAIGIITGTGRRRARTMVDILSQNGNVTVNRRGHVFRQFCHNDGRGRRSNSNVNLKLTVIGRITLARRNSTSI